MLSATARRADWSRRRNPPFADDKEAGYAFGSNPPYGLNVPRTRIERIAREEKPVTAIGPVISLSSSPAAFGCAPSDNARRSVWRAREYHRGRMGTPRSMR
jgi:hypothetical protein